MISQNCNASPAQPMTAARPASVDQNVDGRAIDLRIGIEMAVELAMEHDGVTAALAVAGTIAAAAVAGANPGDVGIIERLHVRGLAGMVELTAAPRQPRRQH